MKIERTLPLTGTILALCVCLVAFAPGARAQTNSGLVEPQAESALAPLEWISVGFGGGGAVQDIVSAPSLPDRMYTCVDVGGVYRSDDGGLHWRPIYAPLSRIVNSAARVYIMGVSHQNPDVFYMVTELGPFTSRDGGHNYQEIGAPIFETYNSQTLCISPDDDRDCVFFFNKQVLRTRDGGKTVASLPLPPELGRKADACQVLFPAKGPEPVIVIGDGRDGKWFRSQDGGARWTQAEMEGWPAGPPTYGPEGHFASLLASFDKTADKPLLTMASGKELEHAYRSADLGDHWRELPMPPTPDKPLRYSNQLTVFPHPTDAGTYAVAHNPTQNHITRDGGKTWAPMLGMAGESGFDHENGGSADGKFIQVFRVHFVAVIPDRVYAINLMDIQRSDDGGRNFAMVSSRVLSKPHHFRSTGPHLMSTGVEGAYINVYAGDPNSGYRYISDDDNGIHRSEDFCRTWFHLQKVTTEPADSGHFNAGQGIWSLDACATILIDSAFNPSRIYAWFNNNGTLNPEGLQYSYKGRVFFEEKSNPFRAGIYMSNNHGEDFQPWSSYRSFPYQWMALTDALAMDPRSPKEKRTIWIAVPCGIFRSDDSGREWVCLNDKIAKSLGATLPDRHDCDGWDNLQWAFARVRLDPTDGRIVYAHLMRRRGKTDQPLAPIIRSSDGGETWQAVASPVKSCPAFEVSPLDPQRLYAADENLGMFVSTDGGKNWNPRGLALNPSRNVNDPLRKESIVRIWPSRRHRDLVFAGVDSVFAAQPNAGIFRSSDNGQTWLDVTGTIPHLRIMNVKEDDIDPRYVYAGTLGGGGFLAFDRLPMPRDGRASVLPIPAGERPKSYIVNGSFEEQKNGQPVGWTLYTAPARSDVLAYLHPSQDNVKEGEWSLKVDIKEPLKSPKDPAAGVVVLFNGTVSPDILKEKGKTLILSGWIYVEPGADPEPAMFRVCLSGSDAEGRATDLGCAIDQKARGKPGEWTRFELTGRLDAQKPIKGVWMQCGWNSGKTATTQYVDDLQLVVKEEPKTPAR